MTHDAPPLIDLSHHTTKASSTRSQQRELAGAAVGELTERLAVPEIDTEIGAHQRHQLRVPTSDTLDGTVVSVGRRQSARSYDGYGLTTVAHVAISAEGGKAQSTATFQSNGQLLLQSDTDSAYLVSMAPAVVASASVVNVAASGGVVIAAGGSVPVTNAAIDGEAPAAPAALEKHTDLMADASSNWETWSGALDEAVDARDTLQDEADPDHKTEWAGTRAAVEDTELATATHVDNNTLGAETESEAGGVALYGEGGLLLGTPKFGAVHAEEALALSSTKVSIVGTEAVDIAGSSDVALSAGVNLGIYAAEKLRVVASTDDLHLATRTGDKAEIQAKAVHIGELEPDDPQEETTLVSMRAKERISLATDADASRDEGGEGIYLETHELIEGKAESTITLEAGETITLKIKDEDISVVVDSGGAITILSEQTKLEVSDSDGLVFGDDQDDYLTASSDKIFAGVDSDNCIEISSSEVAIKGSSIEIG